MKKNISSIMSLFTIGVGCMCIDQSSFAETVPVYAYVTAMSETGNDVVHMIDTATDTIAATVAVGHGALGIGVSPDGGRAYVANAYDDTVSVIDGTNKNVIATISVAREPLGVAVSPDGTSAYVVSSGGVEGATGRLAVINTALNTITTEIPLTNLPTAAALTPNGSHIYVTTLRDSVYVINAATLQIEKTIPTVGQGIESIALASSKPFGYAVNTPVGAVGVLNVAANQVTDNVTIGVNVQAVAVSPDSKKVYATDSDLNQLIVLNAVNRHVTERISLPDSIPVGVSLTPDGKKVYVAGNARSVVFVIDTASNTILTNIPVTGFPQSKGQFIATRPGD